MHILTTARLWTLRLDGAFLLIVGVLARGHLLASGPLANLAGSPITIGGFEAVHLLLGASNLLFLPTFAALGKLAMGVATTACHLGFVAVHAALALRPRGLRPAAM